MRKNKIIALTLTFGLGAALTLNSNNGVVYSEYNNSTTNITTVKTTRGVGQTLEQLIPDTELANIIASEIKVKLASDLTIEDLVKEPLTTQMIESVTIISTGNATDLTGLDTFYNLYTLTIDSKVEVLPEIFNNFNNLVTLTIQGTTSITTLPDSIGNLTSLSKLSIRNNEALVSIPDSIGNLTSLTDLYVERNNKLTALPESIGNLDKLVFLAITKNNLETLPESIGNLTNLTRLHASNNKLSVLPDSILNLSKLTDLLVENNKLTTLPENIHNLSSLQFLFLTNNELTGLPENITKLSNLLNIHAESNKITSLPKDIGKMEQLENLWFSDNLITALPEEMGQFKMLYTLDFSDNLLTNIPASLLNATNDYYKGPLTINFDNNLLSSDVYQELTKGGLSIMDADFLGDDMRKLELNPDIAPIELSSVADYTSLNLSEFVKIKKETPIYGQVEAGVQPPLIGTDITYSEVSPNHILELVQLVDETGKTVSINDYFANGRVLKDAKLFAKVAIKQETGLLTSINPNITTVDQIAFTLTKTPDPVVVTPTPVDKKEEKVTVANPDLYSNAIAENTETDTTKSVTKLTLPTTGNDTNIVALTSVIIVSLGYVITRKKFN